MSLPSSMDAMRPIRLPDVFDTDLECGQTNLEAIAQYFGLPFKRSEVGKLAGSLKVPGLEKNYVVSQGLARAAKLLGMRVEFVSCFIHLNRRPYSLDYYKHNSPGVELVDRVVEELVKDCTNLGVTLRETSLELSEILNRVSEDELPLVLLDWSEVLGNRSRGYMTQYVTVVGSDESFIYVYHCGPFGKNPFYPIPRETFEIARKAFGTDEDVLFLGRPES